MKKILFKSVILTFVFLTANFFVTPTGTGRFIIMNNVHIELSDDDRRKWNMKRYVNAALLYAVLAMAGGVFYREFTKFSGFEGKTALSVVHTHYFMLGMVFFLLLMVLEKNFSFVTAKTKKILAVYHAGLNLTALMLLVRGILQVKLPELSSGIDASVSGIAGIGHILLGVAIVLLLLDMKKSIAD